MMFVCFVIVVCVFYCRLLVDVGGTLFVFCLWVFGLLLRFGVLLIVLWFAWISVVCVIVDAWFGSYYIWVFAGLVLLYAWL